MPRTPKKLTKDELEMAVHVMYMHYGKYFVENADDLANEVSEQFDCDCKPEEVHIYVNVKPVDQEDLELIIKNVFT